MLKLNEKMRELEREDEKVVAISEYNSDYYIYDIIQDSIDNNLIYYADINRQFDEIDSDYKDSVISERTFETFNDYKSAVVYEYLYDYYYSILSEMLVYATLNYMNEALDYDYISEDTYSDIVYYSNNYEYSTLEELLNDLNLLD